VTRLANKVAVITGGAQGIGFAYARRFLAEGARVVVTDVVDTAGAVKRLDADDRVLGIGADVSDAASVRAMVEASVARFGRIDVLINNAAVFATLAPRPFDQIDEAEWDRVMAVNVKGIWNCVRAVAPVMRRQGAGRVVNVASAIVGKGTALLLHYVTSKGAVVAMTRALARELGPDGITVNAIAPGFIETDMTAAMSEKAREAVFAAIPLGRVGRPEDVAGAAVFLVSDAAAYVTGQVLAVDGGFHM
jgi:NAD(P)-dependent dehydrogenase (short-subunit alcohol dehydrogenase family)